MIALALLLALASSNEDDARELFKKAQEDFRVGRFEEALASYTRAYELFPKPQFLFNMGQCHRNLGNYERAIFFFESFLEAWPDAEGRPRVERLIAELEELLEQQREREARAAAAAKVVTSTVTVPVVMPPEEPPLYERAWFWTVVVGAVAVVGGAIATGVVLGRGDGFPHCDTCFDLRSN